MPQSDSTDIGRTPAANRVALLVLGMHRSGTSACARVANLLGASLPEDVLPANDGNETGYWEPRAVVDFNDALLAAAGLGWDDPLPEGRIVRDLQATAVSDAADCIRSVYGDAELIVVKDPRCAMIPRFWADAVSAAGYRPVIVHCTRAAADVAASLQRRDGMHVDQAALLWAQSNISTLRILAQHPNLTLHYGTSVKSWPAELYQFADTAGFIWPRDENSVASEVASFLKPVRPNKGMTFSKSVAGVVDAVSALLSSPQTHPCPESVLDEIEAEIARDAACFLETQSRYRHEIGQLRGALAETGEERDQARRAQSDAELRAQSAQQVINDLETDIENARRAQSDAELRAQSAQQVINDLETEIEDARKAQSDADLRAQSAQQVINGLEKELQRARHAQVDADERAQKAQLYIDDLEDRVRSLAEYLEKYENLESDFKELEASVLAYRTHAERLEVDLKDTQTAFAQADSERLALRIANGELEHRLAAIEGSTIWRATDPLRRLLARMPGLSRWGRRGLKLAWWTATLQLPARLADRRRAAAAPADPADDAAPAPDQALPPLDRLATFLAAEFGLDTTQTISGLIEKYQLPFQREGMPAIATVTPDDTARAWAESIAAIAPPAVAPPRVSIVVPAYNQIAFTLACIESVIRSAPAASFEILVGDDKSSDGTQAAAKVDIPNVRWIRHDPNLGFVRNCNETARAARGEIVVFLNNDTLVLPGWLDELVATLESDETVGLAGSKLVYPDGRLQEAGGIFWQDGSAWNLGRFDDPRRPEFGYAREADYISGASIALRRPVWEEMGGFDELFVPAYAEDADLAFRLRQAGYRTLFQPRSQLLHFEGVSSGTDTGSGIKAHQVTNLERFKARWSKTLAAHRPNGEAPHLEKERAVASRALFVDLTTPEPDHDAGSVVAVECMRGLQTAGFKVTFVPQDNFLWTPEFSAPLQRAGIETVYHPYYSRFTPFVKARGEEFDLVFLHRYQTAERTLADIRQFAPQAKVVLLNADLHYLREMREAELRGDPDAIREAERTRDRELAVMGAVDLVLTHSTVEQEILADALGADKVLLLPLIHDAEPTPAGFGERRGIGFIGGFAHPPNVDAVDWFLAEVWPRVRAADDRAEFALAGSKMPDRFRKLHGRDGISVLGFVESLPDYFNRIRLSVVPLRVGAGAKGKVAASLAAGVPCVSTPVGVEGMQLEAGREIAVAETADALAARILQVFEDEDEWTRYREQGLAYADRVTSRRALRRQIRAMTERLGIGAGPS